MPASAPHAVGRGTQLGRLGPNHSGSLNYRQISCLGLAGWRSAPYDVLLASSWVGGAVPPLVGTLDQGAVITLLGVYQPASMAIGWGCLSADGNQWVSMQWVEAV
jgi:hypothetical protein